MMHMNQLSWTRTDVGAIIHYALAPRYMPIQGVMNDSPYIFYSRVYLFMRIIAPTWECYVLRCRLRLVKSTPMTPSTRRSRPISCRPSNVVTSGKKTGDCPESGVF